MPPRCWSGVLGVDMYMHPSPKTDEQFFNNLYINKPILKGTLRERFMKTVDWIRYVKKRDAAYKRELVEFQYKLANGLLEW